MWKIWLLDCFCWNHFQVSKIQLVEFNLRYNQVSRFSNLQAPSLKIIKRQPFHFLILISQIVWNIFFKFQFVANLCLLLKFLKACRLRSLSQVYANSHMDPLQIFENCRFKYISFFPLLLKMGLICLVPNPHLLVCPLMIDLTLLCLI
jgi:hypothetical protein